VIQKLKTHYLTARQLKTLLAALLITLACSCTKTTESIGDGLLPEGDAIGAYFTDTIQILCHSEAIDTMATKGMTTILLGSMTDPILGVTTANIFTELHLSTTNQRFGPNPSIDSVVLQLGYSGYYGDTTATQTVHVYELADKMDLESDYYQFSDLSECYLGLGGRYSYNSPIGPIALTAQWSNCTKEFSLYFSLGYNF